MGAFNGTRRKATEGLVLHTNQLYHKSFPGEPTKNLAPKRAKLKPTKQSEKIVS